VLQHSRLVWWS